MRKYWPLWLMLAIVLAISIASRIVAWVEAADGDGARQQPIVVVAQPPDHDELRAFSAYLVERGAVVHDVPYTTLEEGARYPQPYVEIACAVAAARSNARSRGVEEPVVTLVGHSTSAYASSVAALGGTSFEHAPCARPELPDRFVGLAGWYDVDRYTPTAVPEAGWLAGKEAFFGGAVIEGARPESHEGGLAVVDVLLVHGTADEDVSEAESRRFSRLLREGGGTVKLRVIEGGTHTSLLAASPGDDSAADAVLAFASVG